jgi:predicted dienelactone hydrolase
MSGVVRSERLRRRPRSRPRLFARNFLLRLGLEERSRHSSFKDDPSVASISHPRRSILALPKDYLRRRRAIRNISNLLLIGGLSVGAAYVITRPIGGRGFTLSAEARRLSAAAPEDAYAPRANPAAVVAARGTGAMVDGEGYGIADGPHAVSEVSDIVLHDAHRNEDLHVRVFYPADAGAYPVIVFSHGAGGSQTCCDSLTRHWASYGYVTVQPTHDDSVLLRRNEGEESVRFLQAVRDALKKPALWQSRPEDISFVLDSLPTLEKRISNLAGRIDAGHIGVGGHSMGSYTTEAIAGALIDLPGHSGTSFLDPRVKAVLCLSPQGPGQFGLTEGSFDRISLPYLAVTGSLDSLGPIVSPAWHKVPFDRSVGGDKYHVFIQGANHMSFISAQTVSAAHESPSQAILGYTNSAALAFWDAYLKGDAAAKSYLESNRREAKSHNAVKLYLR